MILAAFMVIFCIIAVLMIGICCIPRSKYDNEVHDKAQLKYIEEKTHE